MGTCRSSITQHLLIFSFFAFSLLLLLLLLLSSIPAAYASDPQTNLHLLACSGIKLNTSTFFTNLNDSFADIRSQLNASSFATATRTRVTDPVYSLFQCRDYLSTADCISCFTTAETMIRNCSSANGGRILFDGCILRYESNNFYDQTTQDGNMGFCGNRSVTNEVGFNDTASQLLKDLAVATPRTSGYYAAVKKVGSGGAVVYGMAQCVRNVTESGCGDCLRVAHGNIESCPPDAQGRALDAGCFMRYSSTAFFRDNQSMDIAPYLIEPKKRNKRAIIGGVVGGAAALFLFSFVLFVIVARSKKTQKIQKGDILEATELRGPENFHYKDLKSATKNFSEENRLRGGGFGEVYKGVLKNGKIVAVKKLTIGQSSKVKIDFESEAKLISNVHHRNLIRLLGCCKRGGQLLLIYEYMANGSLEKYLFGERRGALNWKERFNVILGMARGLAYLHEEFHSSIIHRDIKSSNILLDEEFQPKIADFGLARLLPEDQSHLSTKFAGTMGYTAPEYAIHGQLSKKVDTYSYGVVVLEIISGLESNDMRREPAKQYLLEWAWNLHENDMLTDLVDEKLDRSECTAGELKKVIDIALMCTQSSVASRPNMSEVVVMLLSSSETVQEPTRPVFIDVTNRVRGDAPHSTESSPSMATMSTSLSAR